MNKPSTQAPSPLLQLENLSVTFATADGPLPAVRSANLCLHEGETVCLVGESGCGKSLTAKSILQLTPPNAVLDGRILLYGQNLLELSEKEMRSVRGRQVGMIFQEPMTSLNPVLKIGDQVAEPLRLHQGMNRSEAREAAIELLTEVGIPAPQSRYDDYPHQLSGGMRQRVMIAMALACEPDILIADEPTTALDVTIQAQILDLMKSLQKELGMAIILITHDLGVVAQMCDEVIVMYAGSICEQGTADEIFYNPCHEYTKGLLRSIPSASNVGEKLEPIHGTPIDLLNMPAGCPFAPRCEAAMKICLRERAERMRINEDHLASCWMNVKKGLEDGSIELAEDKDAERKDGADA